MTKNLTLLPISKQIVATLSLAGSKSIANRVLPLAMLARGVSIIHNVPIISEDVNLMLQALNTLGIKYEQFNLSKDSASYQICGCCGKIPNLNAEIFLGNSGTSYRFLTAILALQKLANYKLTGVPRMKERPIKDLVDPLIMLGAKINYLDQDFYPPLELLGFNANDLDYIELSGKLSSQFVTGLILAIASLAKTVTVKIIDGLISRPYVTITIELLKLFGVSAYWLDNYTLLINPLKNDLHACEYIIEPDASSASYFLAMGAVNGDITINQLSNNSLQGDKNFAKVLALMGAEVNYQPNATQVKKGDLSGIEIDMEDMPDVAMTIAVLALFATGETKITGIRSWKIKETDRILAMSTELRKLGAQVNYGDDFIIITPAIKVKPNQAIDTYNDHRMAMSFSLIPFLGVMVTINDYQCVNKTFANYFELFNKLSS